MPLGKENLKKTTWQIMKRINEVTQMGYAVGDLVCSVGGCFTEGKIEAIRQESSMEILTIRWTKHSEKGKINFVQDRASSIVRKF